MNAEFEPAHLGAHADGEASDRRMHRNTYIVIAVAILLGLIGFGWQMAAGIAVGGTLSILNQRWLRSSVAAILGTAAQNKSGKVPRWTVSKFLLRYAVIGAVAGLALWSRKLDLIGFGIGLASFVWSVMIEAGYQAYLSLRFKDQVKS